MNATTDTAATASVSCKFSGLTRTTIETLTVGQPVLITLDNGRTISGYVCIVQDLSNMGRSVTIMDSEGKVFGLSHYLSSNPITAARVGCLAMGTLAKIKVSPKSVFSCGVCVVESYT